VRRRTVGEHDASTGGVVAGHHRGNADARVVFVLVDGAFRQPLLETLPADAH
jgi:hypothetical protein